MSAPSLTEWLLAQIAEDEAVARASHHVRGKWAEVVSADRCWTEILSSEVGEGFAAKCADDDVAAHIARHDPARVLAECASKRAIVEEFIATSEYCESHPDDPSAHVLGDVLCMLAAVYRDRPGWREEWAA